MVFLKLKTVSVQLVEKEQVVENPFDFHCAYCPHYYGQSQRDNSCCDRKLALCSVTHLFIGKTYRAQSSWIDFLYYKPIFCDYKTAFQYMQLTITESEPNNLEEIGHCSKN
jgi:hypothetical protein